MCTVGTGESYAEPGKEVLDPARAGSGKEQRVGKKQGRDHSFESRNVRKGNRIFVRCEEEGFREGWISVQLQNHESPFPEMLGEGIGVPQ